MYDFTLASDRARYRRSKAFKEIKEALFKKYDHQCYICGTVHKKGLHPHHLDPSTYGRETVDDLIPLCPTDHKIIEWMMSKTKNKIDIESYCHNLREIYDASIHT